MIIYKCDDLSCYYRLNGEVLEYVNMNDDDTFDTDEFVDVEPDLVGDELVTFQGKEVTLNDVYQVARDILVARQPEEQ